MRAAVATLTALVFALGLTSVLGTAYGSYGSIGSYGAGTYGASTYGAGSYGKGSYYGAGSSYYGGGSSHYGGGSSHYGGGSYTGYGTKGYHGYGSGKHSATIVRTPYPVPVPVPNPGAEGDDGLLGGNGGLVLFSLPLLLLLLTRNSG